MTSLPTKTLEPTFIPTFANTLAPTQTQTQEPISIASIAPVSQPGSETEKIRQADGMPIIYIPAGNFTMGSENYYDNEKPVHDVYLDAYWIDKFEVTNAQYQMCVNVDKCVAPKKSRSFTRDHYYDDPNYAHFPVMYVTWFNAQDYCEWAGGRLPTEAEWEKAARGDTVTRVYPWGGALDGGKANYCDRNCESDKKDPNVNDGYGDTAPIGNYPEGASPFGAMDMAGNVWEWVADWYGAEYYSRQTTWSNPTGPTSGEDRVIRGGSWINTAIIMRVSNRYSYSSDTTYSSIGFRCVASP
jgi:formylglycine-generating enzyme required for sulfatase activity